MADCRGQRDSSYRELPGNPRRLGRRAWAPCREQKGPYGLYADVLVFAGGCALELADTVSVVTGDPGSWTQSVLQVLFTERSLWVSWGQGRDEGTVTDDAGRCWA